MKSTGGMQTDRRQLRSRFGVDSLSKLSLPVLAQRHVACSLNAFAPRFALRSLLHFEAGCSHVFAYVFVRINVRMDCFERVMPQAWLALFDWQAVPWAAPPELRGSVLSDPKKMQGKIKGRGTSVRENLVCTWGWRGTRLIAAPCRAIGQRFAGLGKSACWRCSDAMALDGDTA